MKNDGRYTPSTCFETFPFPARNPRLTTTGEALYIARTAAQRHFQLGLTKLWNRVEDLSDDDPKILELRHLRAEMDSAVIAAYGWEGELNTKEIIRRLRLENGKRPKA